MTEHVKTTTFVAIAAVIGLIVWATRPPSPVVNRDDMRGRQLFPDFNDPLKAASMNIVTFDEDKSVVRPFEVAQADTKDGKRRWSIPSHDNYPAEAKDQLAEAAAGLMGLKILDMPSDSPGDHELYGVIDPDPKKLKVGTTGVGTRVTMKDSAGKTLLSLIIGKEVPDRDGLRYVRRPGTDQVFTTAIKTDKLSTKFKDWIEPDLLKLNTWDIKRLSVLDYSFDELQGIPQIRGQLALEYDDTGDPKWKLTEDRVIENGKWVEPKADEQQELDTSRLDEMKTALDDLKIVDVRRKPAGLSADLKKAKGLRIDAEAQRSLAARGFYLVPVGNQQLELFSNEGEVRCLMKSGVQYVLRFGEIATGSAAESSDEEKANSSGLNRYIFVMAEFNADAVPKPELEPLPEAQPEPAGKEKPEAETTESETTETETTESESNAEETAPAESQPSKTEQDAPEPEEDEDAPKPQEDPAKPEEDQDAAEPQDDEDAAEPDEEPDIEQQRQRIEKDNKRKQDEYDEKIKEGQDKVNELNARFADWYYIISDEVYQKIHLTRENIFKKKEKEKDEGEDKDADADTSQDHADADKGDHDHGDADDADDADATGTDADESDADNPLRQLDDLKQQGPAGKQ